MLFRSVSQSRYGHAIIEGFTKSYDTLRNYIRSSGITGKGYAVSTQRHDTGHEGKSIDSDYITYMSKGHLDPKRFGGYTQEFIDAKRSQWIDHEAKKTLLLEGGKLVVHDEERKQKTKKELLEIMVANIKDDMTQLEVLEEIRKVLVKERQVIGMYKVMDYYDSYLMYAQKGKWLQMLAAKINSRIPVYNG